MPCALASQLMRDRFGVQLEASSTATFVKTRHQQLSEMETQLQETVVKALVLNQDETGLRVGTRG